MKKIIVTGGAGFIGSHTCVELYNAGYIPIILDNFINSERFICENINEILGKKVKLVELDCKNYPELLEEFKTEKDIVGIIHFAALKAVGDSVNNPLEYYENNLLSLINLLKLCRELRIENFVFSSSCTVYGEPDKLPVDESEPVKKTTSPYGNTKQVGEEIIEDFINSGVDLKCTSLRYFNPIGAHSSGKIGELPLNKPNNLVPFITQTAIGKYPKLTVFGNDYPTIDGTNIRDYIHVVDLARAHVSAIDFLNSQTEKNYLDYFNLGTGTGNSVLEVIKAFENATGEKLNYEIGPRRKGDVVAVYADSSKANKVLNWKTELSLERALKDAWRWEKNIRNSK